MFKRFFKALGLIHDQSEAIGIEGKKAVQKPVEKLPDDVRINRNGKLERVQFTADSAQWENISTKQVAKVAQLTDADLQALADSNLDSAKAAQIKVHWAQGSSQTEAAAALGNGFSKRTLAKYWVVFNSNS
jgi:hypothetical protein